MYLRIFLLLNLTNMFNVLSYKWIECSKPFTLENLKRFVPEINETSVSGKLFLVSEKYCYFLASRSRYTSYCYKGLPFDSNTGCEHKKMNILPDKQEIKEWIKKDGCKIGHQCYSDGDCWGSDSDKCHDYSMDTMTKGVKHHTLFSRYFVPLRHSCVSSWECNIHHVVPQAIVSGDYVYQNVHVTLPNGSLIEQSKLKEPVVINDGEMVIWSLSNEGMNTIAVKLDCLKTSKGRTMCVVRTKGKFDGVVVNIYKGCGKVSGALVCIDPVETYKLDPLSSKLSAEDESSYKTASMRDIMDLQTEISFVQRQMDYNIMEISSEMDQIKQVLYIVISSVSKIDDRLLGNILGKMEFRTVWLNSQIFKMCKSDIFGDGLSNCDGKKSFYKGRTLGKRGEQCFSESITNIQNMTLFDKIKMNLIQDTKILPSNSYIDSDGWTWAHESIISLQNNFTHATTTSLVRIASNVFESLNPFSGAWEWFTKCSSVVGWIALILAILKK